MKKVKKIDRHKKNSKKQSFQLKDVSFRTLFIFNALIISILFIFFPVRYKENDDVCMALLSSGSYGGTPEAHLVFINYVYGLLLKFFYLITNSIEWYSLLFAILHIVSLTVISKSVLKEGVNNIIKLLFLLLFYVIEIRIIILFQFTTTAALASLAGLILIRGQNNSQRLLGVFLFVVGSLIRIEASLLVLLIFAPMFLKESFDNKKFIFTQSIKYIGIAILFVGLLKYTDHISYKESTWKTYSEYNQLRSKINDNPNAIKIKDNLPPNVSITDYFLLWSCFPDKNIMNPSKMEALYNKISDLSFSQKIKNIIPGLTTYKIRLLLIFLIVGSLILYSVNFSNKLVISSCFVIFIFACIMITLNGLLKKRVFISAMLPLLYVITVCFEYIKGRRMYFLPLFISLLIVFFSEKIYRYSLENKFGEIVFADQQHLIRNYLSDSQKSIVPFAADYNIEFQSPFTISKSHFKERIFFSGWFTGIPANTNHFDSYKDLINGHGLFINRRSEQVVPLIAQSIYNNYGINVNPNIVAETQSYLIIEFVSL